ncbi:hypothetical protein [Mesobacillus subterraneus]|uniref:Uncharacterized protein n=1 Tax=Mesobacillus subterraneus TaxID=285983 RepID=A0A3R9EZG3_9BACI|nr:hypothetical protein [Mesobacillus subterraneus]RSD26640.1 hypothetical protein EJA10_12225 [Mesobacillus subterraneus]
MKHLAFLSVRRNKEAIPIGKIISFILTLLIIGLINFGLTSVTSYSFIDASPFVGAASVFLIYFFSSAGGIASRHVDMQVQAETGIKMNQTEKKFLPSYAFLAAIVYLIGSIVATFWVYRDYFFQ